MAHTTNPASVCLFRSDSKPEAHAFLDDVLGYEVKELGAARTEHGRGVTYPDAECREDVNAPDGKCFEVWAAPATIDTPDAAPAAPPADLAAIIAEAVTQALAKAKR